MPRALIARLLGRTDSDRGAEDASADESDGEGDGEDTDEAGFLPSRLDASVLFAHGMGSSQAERELTSVEEKAKILEDEHRED